MTLGGYDINLLKYWLSSLSNSQSLQELFVRCDASGVFSGCPVYACMYVLAHTHTCMHMPHIFKMCFTNEMFCLTCLCGGIHQVVFEFLPLSVMGCIMLGVLGYVFHVLCLLPMLNTVQGSHILFIHLGHNMLLYFLSVFRCWSGPG